MLAAQQGAQDCVKVLVAHNANLDATRADGGTAMSLAKRAGEFHILRMLWRAASKRRARRFGLGNRRK
jgi:ankyrin repeat protein